MIVLIHGIFCPTKIVLLLESFCLKMSVMFLCDSLKDIFPHQEDFRHRNFRGCFGVVDVSYFERHTNNYSDNGEQALILSN